MINPSLRNELSLFTLFGAFLAWRRFKNKAAIGLSLATLALRYLPLPSPFNYHGKHVVITGGSRGLGLALAEELVSQGARVSLLARNIDELDDALVQLGQDPSAEAVAFPCDITRPNELLLALNSAHQHFGQIDMLINNAGTIAVGPFECMEDDDFNAQIRLYLNAVVEATRQTIPYFKRLGGGRIVNITSIGGKIAVPHMTTYCAAKFAMAGFSRAVASEMREHGIHITTVYPGLMRTGSPIQAVFKGDPAKEFAWFATSDLAPVISMSADRAARQILAAAAGNEREVILGWPAKLGNFANANFPEITGRLLELAARLMPRGRSLDRKTGAQVFTLFRQQFWTRPFARVEERVAARYNQTPQPDAEYALGVQSPNVF